VDSDFEAPDAAALSDDGDCFGILDRHVDSGGSGHHHIGRSFVALLDQRMDCGRGTGLFATASTTFLWNWGLKRVPASQAGIFVNLEPLVAAILGVSLLHEQLGSMALAGGALIIGGAVYFSYEPIVGSA
jgi:EamA-like transporter family